jgi:glycosyltransferase involved in cell wall biosynthesis
VCGDPSRIGLVVVIPALAEKGYLFDTLASLAANPVDQLAGTLVIVVVNNGPRETVDREVFADNQETIAILNGLIAGRTRGSRFADRRLRGILDVLQGSGLRIGLIDASSPGSEIPSSWAGVGTARKIGLDLALTLRPEPGERPVLVCLDADTIVAPDYLSAIRSHFRDPAQGAAVIAFEHPLPDDTGRRAAILCYELFLRYYILGLSWAGSPYAFYSIGSTMVFTPDRYVAVRGMSRRTAGEDFYFLNKLRKAGPISSLNGTRVRPSERLSDRVPFGTGKRMIRHLAGERDEYLFYHREIFITLRKWLELMEESWRRPAEAILKAASELDPGLRVFLEQQNFLKIWPRLQRQAGNPGAAQRAFHTWFDGFRTLRFVHELAASAYPPQPMASALSWLLRAWGQNGPAPGERGFSGDLQAQEACLMTLRGLERPETRRGAF